MWPMHGVMHPVLVSVVSNFRVVSHIVAFSAATFLPPSTPTVVRFLEAIGTPIITFGTVLCRRPVLPITFRVLWSTARVNRTFLLLTVPRRCGSIL